MGGDDAPLAPVEGAVHASMHNGIPVLLVGDEKLINAQIESIGEDVPDITVKHAPEVIGMRDGAVASMKSKPENSIKKCFDALVSGEAQALFSAGNTGAVLAGSVMFSGRMKGIDRPAVLATLPAVEGEFVFIDAGANTACRARHMVQFAMMGAAYAKEIMGGEVPRVGLLSNGTEESKGTEIQKKAREKIKSIEGIEFVGFVEGDEIMHCDVDVVVTDGFTGNLVLKTIEGVGEFMVEGLADLFHRGALDFIGKAILRDRIEKLRNRVDYAQYGGAPLVGVNHPCVVGHGRSSAAAISNGIKLAAQFATCGYNRKLECALRTNSLKSPEEVKS